MGDAPPRVVIVGGGFGGLNAARELARARVEVTLIDRRNHHLFQPLLYQVATAALNPSDIAIADPSRAPQPEERRGAPRGGPGGRSVREGRLPRRGDRALRPPDRGDRRAALVLRTRRLGAVCPRLEEHRRRARDPPSRPLGVRVRRAREGPGAARRVADVRDRGRRADGRRALGRAVRDRAPRPGARLPSHQPQAGPGDPPRRIRSRPAAVHPRAQREGAPAARAPRGRRAHRAER